MDIFDKIKQLREQKAQQREEDMESYVNRSYAEMFRDYKENADRDAKTASFMQTLSSGAQFMSNNKAIDRLKVERTPNISTGQVSLSSFDIRPQATRKLDQSFNSMINFSRESGQRVDPLMLSKYSDAITGINSEQARLNNDVRNQEGLINFQAYERTKELNAANEARYNEATDKLNLYQTGMGMDNLNRLAVGLANINNIRMSHKANVLSAEAGFKKLQDEADLTNRLYPPLTPPPPPADPNKGKVVEDPVVGNSVVKPSVMPSLFGGMKSGFDLGFGTVPTIPEIKQGLFGMSGIFSKDNSIKKGVPEQRVAKEEISAFFTEDDKKSNRVRVPAEEVTREEIPVPSSKKDEKSRGIPEERVPRSTIEGLKAKDAGLSTIAANTANFDETTAGFIKANENKDYTLGAKSKSDSTDCSGLVCDYIDEVGDPNAYAEDKSSQGLWTQSDEKKSYQTKEDFLADAESIPNNTIIAFSTGNDLGKNRAYGIDHVGVVVTDKSGKKYIMESSSTKKGFAITPLEERIAEIPLDNAKGKGVIFTGKIKS